MHGLYKKFDINPDSLLGCRFFDNLDHSERTRIVRYCEGRCYRAGAEILAYGESTRDVYFLSAGRVQAMMLTNAGRIVTFQQLEGGDMFGELSAIDQEPRSTSVVAVEESSLLRISGSNFKNLIAQHPILAERTMLRLCALSRFLCERSFEARAYSIPRQIALEIFRIISANAAPSSTREIDPAPSHEDIAQRIGTNREQVTRVISKLTKAQLLEQSRKRWSIPDVPALLKHLADSPPA